MLGIIAKRQHAAGGANLDDVRSVLDDLTHLVLHILHAAGDADLRGMPLVRQQVVVPMVAGDAERWTGGVDARPRDVTRVDGVAESDVGKFGGADVANGGEAGQKSDTSVFGSNQSFARK